MTTYYVDSALGNDANAGTSPGSGNAWQTLGKVNGFSFSSGDIVQFQGGQSFTNASGLSPKSNVTYQSYGTGRATIHGPNGAVFMGGGILSVTLNNLFFQQDTTNNNHVISTSGAANTPCTISNCIVDGNAGTAKGGFTISGATATNPITITTTAAHPFQTGDHVDITGCTGNTVPNGGWSITRTGSTTFTIPASGSGVYNANSGTCGFGNVGIITGAGENWTITNTTIQHTGDSGCIFAGDGSTFTNCTINDVGYNTGLGSFGKHGVYAKFANGTFTGCTITNIGNGSCISLRKRNARVEKCVLAAASTAGVSYFFEDTTAAGKTIIDYNIMYGHSAFGIYYDNLGNGGTFKDDYVICNNTIDCPVSTDGINLDGGHLANMTIRNNIVLGSPTNAILARVPDSGKNYLEDHNCFSGQSGSVFRWGTNAGVYTSYTFANYQVQSGQGSNSTITAASLTASPNYVENAGSVTIDAGTTTVDGSLTYTPGTDGAAFHYAGSAPDMGAVEFIPVTVAGDSPFNAALAILLLETP